MNSPNLKDWFKRLGMAAVVVSLIFVVLLLMQTRQIDAEIDAYLVEQVKAADIPGLAVAVVQNGSVIFSRAYGVRELGKEEKLTSEHVFHFASVSKPFVATAIVQLAERGKLELNDPMVKHLPYFHLSDERYREITIQQILNHTSGMPDVEDYEWEKPQFDDDAAERYVRLMASESLLWAPGSGWAYSNMAFDMLGDLIAKVSGVSFEEYVRINILEPIGMNDSSFIYPEIDESFRTTGHVGNPAMVSDIYPYNRRHAPSSTLNSSVAEMTRWMLVNLGRGELDGRRILSAESHDTLWTRSTELITTRGEEIGLSWLLGERAGHRTVLHGGRDTGFRSYILLLPDDGIGIVVASNWQETDRTTLTHGILDRILAFDDG